ncbi:MAG: hypothetical protein A2Y14_02385 [Verrucomicrobia bacterium GWF2_51_19]|nr:MAG: hypothetical protein A2Y14_02385 [Verrucomicrobia bacterium GWF2_51_19]HCJ11962.1 hypothetical protein [Opitutae bacterium]
MRLLKRKLSLREKGLLTACVWGILCLWLSSELKGFRELNGQVDTIEKALKKQSVWIANEGLIRERLQQLVSRLDIKKSLDRNTFAGRVDELAAKSAIHYTLESPKEQAGDVFDIFSLKLRFRDCDLPSLIAFEKAIYDESPYMSVESLQMKPNPTNPQLLNGTFAILGMKLTLK